jgi:hypothetical protein
MEMRHYNAASVTWHWDQQLLFITRQPITQTATTTLPEAKRAAAPC